MNPEDTNEQDVQTTLSDTANQMYQAISQRLADAEPADRPQFQVLNPASVQWNVEPADSPLIGEIDPTREMVRRISERASRRENLDDIIDDLVTQISELSTRRNISFSEAANRTLPNIMVSLDQMGHPMSDDMMNQIYSRLSIPPLKKPRKLKGESGLGLILATLALEIKGELENQLETKKGEYDRSLKDLANHKRKVRGTESALSVLETQVNATANKSLKTLQNKFKKEVTRLNTIPLLDSWWIDDERRLVVKTKDLIIRKSRWRKDRVAGQYLIRFDFRTTQGLLDNVRVLNITKRFNDYDSPTISHTKPCWGNIRNDIYLDLQTGNVYDLVNDMIGYICSPNDSAGFVAHPSKGSEYAWEHWFDRAKKSKFLTFEELDTETDRLIAEEREREQREITSEGATTTANIFNGVVSLNGTSTMAYYDRGLIAHAERSLSPYHNFIARELESRLNFTRESARTFAQMIADIRDRSTFVNSYPLHVIELHGDQMVIYYRQHMPVTLTETAMEAMLAETRVQSLNFNPRFDFTDEGQRIYEERGQRSHYMFSLEAANLHRELVETVGTELERERRDAEAVARIQLERGAAQNRISPIFTASGVEFRNEPGSAIVDNGTGGSLGVGLRSY